MATAENKQIIEKVNEAFENNSTEGFLGNCADNVVWNMPGNGVFNGIEAIRKFMNEGAAQIPLFTIKSMIAENDLVMCNGEMKMKNKDGIAEDYGFCDLYNIESGKIIEITSYIIMLKK